MKAIKFEQKGITGFNKEKLNRLSDAIKSKNAELIEDEITTLSQGMGVGEAQFIENDKLRLFIWKTKSGVLVHSDKLKYSKKLGGTTLTLLNSNELAIFNRRK